MSSPEKPEALAAHPPAVKVGGMRITQDKSHLATKKKNEAPVPKPEEDALKVSTSPPKQLDLMSGATSKGHADFPPAAVESFHVKPLPTVSSRSSNKPTVHIQQPKK